MRESRGFARCPIVRPSLGFLLFAIWLTPLSAGAADSATPQAYRVQVGDVLEIVFFNTPQMSQERVVGPQGLGNLLLVGPLQVSGHNDRGAHQGACDLADPPDLLRALRAGPSRHRPRRKAARGRGLLCRQPRGPRLSTDVPQRDPERLLDCLVLLPCSSSTPRAWSSLPAISHGS